MSASNAATEHPLYLFVSDKGAYALGGLVEAKAMYRLACRECGSAFEEDETPVPSRQMGLLLVRGAGMTSAATGR